MKNMGLIELTSEEMISIEGGKPLSYYIGYAAGYFWTTYQDFCDAVKNGLSDGYKASTTM